jgi:gliding motility-associated-like protein
MRLIVCLSILICSLGYTYAQDKSNRGKEFWLAYGFDYTFFNESPVNSQDFAIYISTEQQAATVTVRVTNTGYTQTLTIPANTVNATIIIPKSGADDARTLTDGLQNRNIHILSDVPVAAYAHVYATQVSGATMLMPVDTYGYSYRSINYYQTTSQSSPNDWYSWFYVIASEDNTRINITPSDTTKNGWLPGQTYTVNLNRGESYHVFGKATFNGNPAFASKDMTGTKAVSVPGADGNCHPIGAFSGSGGIRLCRGDGGEFMHQQIFPTQAWGTRYLTYHTINNISTNINETFRNYYRICVLDPTTIVKKNGVPMTGLIKGFFYEHMDSTGGDYFESDKPIMVSQYTPNKNQCWNFPTTSPSPPSYGDPEMFYLSPIEQGQKSVLFYVSRKSSIDYVYANIHVPTAGLTTLRVNGNAVPPTQIVTHPNYPTYSVALVRFLGAASQHRITCDSAFTSTVYGLGNYESYGYNVGTLINNLNNYGVIQNTQSTLNATDTVTCPKTPFRVFVKLGYPATNIHWKLSQATGITPNTDSIINNPTPVRTEVINGRTYYVYSLQQDFSFANSGTYNIPITYGAAVIENCSQSETANIRIVVKPGPTADFTYTSTGCAKDSVYFTGVVNAGGFNINQYLWNFDDNTTANTINTVKKFTSGLTQNVRFRVYADNGCAADTTKPLAFVANPVAKFGYSSNICVGDSIQFRDSSTVATGTITTRRWDFGDGTTATFTNANPFYHPYSIPGNYWVSLVVTSNNSCVSDTFKLQVSVNHKPLAKFGIQNPNICLGDSIRITDSSTLVNGTITTWRWNFGDGVTTTLNNNSPLSHTYTLPGSYSVSLVVSPTNGCISDTFRLPVTVGVKPVTKFGVNKTSFCQRDSVLISDSSTIASGTIASWKWDFGNGNTIIKTNNTPFYQPYNTPGNYIISLVTIPVIGCAGDTFRIAITVSPKPVAKFGYSNNICVNDSIRFSDSSTISQGTIINRKWDLGDGTIINTNSSAPFYHPYNTAGTFPVTLVITPSTGCTDTFRLNVIVSHKPIAKFGVSSTAICLRDSIKISDSSTIAQGNINNWKWLLGDGNVFNFTNNNPFYHTYTTPGNFTIALIAAPSNGCVSDTFRIPVSIAPKPVANFSFDRNICINDSIRFTDNSTIIGSTISAWRWNFGDGNTATFNNNTPFYHTYTTAGIFTVTLVTTPVIGCVSDTFRTNVSVHGKPIANFTTNGKACVDSTFTFTSSVTPVVGTTNPSWYWSFGNGQTINSSATNIATNTYTTSATNIPVKHMVSFGPGCVSDTVTNIIPVINIVPTASFTIIGDTLCVQKPLLFNAATNPAITNWNWQIGTTTVTTPPPFNYSFTTSGPYNIQLRVTDNNGCTSAAASRNLIISPTPVLNAGADKIINPGNSVTLDASILNPLAYQFTWTPATYLSNGNVLNPVATPPADITYTIRATNTLSLCTATDQVLVRVVNKLSVPNAFSPNGDGINDTWRIDGMELYPKAVVMLFSRWGQKIWESANYSTQPWNGTKNGKIQPVGTYAYIIELNNDNKERVAGTVTLLR